MLKEAREISRFYKASNFQRRKCPRCSTVLPIEYWRINYSKSGLGQTINIAEGGLLVSLPEQIEVDEKLRVKLFFSFGPGLNTIEAIVKVVWAKIDAEKEGFYRHELSFLNISRSDIKKAINFLNVFSD